uniref:leucine-rich repeat and guanylate kinase domain-containing protein-like n=1 Tax=Panthera onca TaxID=9690 RepID=UPI002953445A|nr:leucine-rich repeat and guanylate kinase domain-containing protein-like [Panthera onca]
MLFPNSRSTDQFQLLKTYFYQNIFHFESQAARSRLVISSAFRACHTTRPPYFGEGDRVDYHFISQEVFDEMVNMGKFILTFNYGNHNYGLSRDTIEAIARDGLASCVHMEIEGVRSLKYSYFEPRYILVVPMNKEKYEGYLRRKGLFSRLEIEFAVSRVDLYVKINQQFPGYFDAVINADDLDAAYQKLSHLIREYLGLSEETSKDLAPTAGTTLSLLCQNFLFSWRGEQICGCSSPSLKLVLTLESLHFLRCDCPRKRAVWISPPGLSLYLSQWP